MAGWKIAPPCCSFSCCGCCRKTEPVFKVGDKVEHQWRFGLFVLTRAPYQKRDITFVDGVSFQTGEALTHLRTDLLRLVHGHVHIDR